MTRPAASRDLALGSTPTFPTDLPDSGAQGPAPLAARLMVRRPRLRALAAAAALGAGVFLAACSTQSPAQTNVPYQPADGVAANVGTVQARNLVLLTTAKGAPVRLSGAVINSGTEQVAVTFSLSPATSTATPTTSATTGASGDSAANASSGLSLPASQHQQLTTIQFASSPAAPGAMSGVTMTTPAGSALVQVPVLLPDQYYSSLSPTAEASAKP